MEIIRTIEWMKQIAHDARAKEHVLGLIPTMGALHEGHVSLVRAAKQDCSPVVASIFVNPMQFGPGEDLQKYPRTFERDAAALENLGVNYLFAPEASEMYPGGFRTSVSVEGLSDRLEGRSRPGHFRGVTTVVLKLFEIVQPQRAYFGRKDAQQLRIIRQMAADLNLDTQIITCPIIREPDGLAMSSRNAYLQGDARRAATVLYRALVSAKKEIEAGQIEAARLVEIMRQVFEKEPNAALDYAEIVDADTLEPVLRLRKTCLALVAAFVGKTRLIDNALIEDCDDAISVIL
ncbi:MAG TPA: pantoate--beta-alanine ligase [Candidatus Acidoferrales bacterium]|nr:pantoate--beta-alanine ligase [Candidatus Acidoferrales bacterium]